MTTLRRDAQLYGVFFDLLYAIAEQHDFCEICLPAEPLNKVKQSCAVPAALFALFDYHIFQEREWLPCMHWIQVESQERGSNNMAASFQDPKKVVRVRANFGKSLFQDVNMFVWSDRTDQTANKVERQRMRPRAQ